MDETPPDIAVDHADVSVLSVLPQHVQHVITYTIIQKPLPYTNSVQWFMQDQNVARRWTCARPSRNLASTRGDGKRSEQSYVLETVIHKN